MTNAQASGRKPAHRPTRSMQTAIAATPGADNTLLNQVVLQAPDVVQDSFGQFHVRGDHNDLQYRINGIILPEGINVFGQSLSPRPISALKLITGALPAQYGLRTAGIIDITTKSGLLDPGGSISVYGGAHDTVQPSFVYGGSSDNLNYFVTGDYLSSDMGIESPDRSSDPIHDDTTQYHGFGYFEDILDPDNRLSLIVGTSNGKFEIPNKSGLEPSLGLTVLGISEFPSQALDENQDEMTNYAIVSWQHSQGALDWQTSLSARYSRLTFIPIPSATCCTTASRRMRYKAMSRSAGRPTALIASTTHTRCAPAGISSTTAPRPNQLPRCCRRTPPAIRSAISRSPLPTTARRHNGSRAFTVEDEWTVASTLTVNYGLRFDHYDGFSNGEQLSPRINVVWVPVAETTVHAGYSRYFTPPPFELVAQRDDREVRQHHRGARGFARHSTKAERADYYDVGFQQQLFEALTLGVDGYYRHRCT